MRLRVAATSVCAGVVALVNAATSGRETSRAVLQRGDEAPTFSLPGSDGRTHALAEFRGQKTVVLAWFPKAFTGGCTVECESIGARAERLREHDAVVFGMNIDTPETNREFARSTQVGFPILSDADGSVARAYGVLNASGFPSRWTFYIGLDGRILEIDKQVRVSTHGTDIERMLNALTAARQA
jgi:peroxiredoxin Q/BCP